MGTGKHYYRLCGAVEITSLLMNLKPRDDIYGHYNPSFLQSTGPIQHTKAPIVTGTSVIAIKYKDGVVIAADNLGMLPKRLLPFTLSMLLTVWVKLHMDHWQGSET